LEENCLYCSKFDKNKFECRAGLTPELCKQLKLQQKCFACAWARVFWNEQGVKVAECELPEWDVEKCASTVYAKFKPRLSIDIRA
jgi:hypothetical protein